MTEELVKGGRVCGRHFVSGRPVLYWEKTNVDWVPMVNVGHNKTGGDTDIVQAAKSARNYIGLKQDKTGSTKERCRSQQHRLPNSKRTLKKAIP